VGNHQPAGDIAGDIHVVAHGGIIGSKGNSRGLAQARSRGVDAFFQTDTGHSGKRGCCRSRSGKVREGDFGAVAASRRRRSVANHRPSCEAAGTARNAGGNDASAAVDSDC
jgi:hypothetical protein